MTLPLKNVVLYQNGLGYFERSGELSGDRLRLRLRANEVDDILKSLTVLGAGEHAAIGAVASLRPRGEDQDLVLTLPPGAARTIKVSYAAPTPVWRAAYRVVLDEQAGRALVQAWAIVANPSDEDWRDVHLTLATGAPLSFAVDLHTPRMIERPDATGHFVHAVATGVVGSESAAPPAADRDHDGIPDELDKCPEQPETYNGYEDDDGCPDRGRVIVTEGRLEVLDKIYFAHGSGDVKPVSRPILDAVAATLQGNPQIRLLEVGGFTADDEPGALGLSAQRAGAVVSYLVGKGVARARLQIRSYGVARPTRAGHDENARAMNRRVEFLILKRDAATDGDEDKAVARRPTEATVEQSVRPVAATLVDVAGMSRYELTAPISIPHGTSGMIAILNERVAGEEVYLYRPSDAAPGSELHPFRAARMAAPAGTSLEPGPVAIYARGTFVGDAILDRLHAGETTFLPFAIDSSTVIHREEAAASAPLRLVTVARGVATVEDREVHTVRYEIRAGEAPPRRVFVRHERREGYALRGTHAGAQETADGLLVPVDLTARQTATLAIEEERPGRREVTILSPGDTDLRAYLTGSTLPAPFRKAFDEAIALRAELGTLEASEAALRKRVEDAAERQGQLRDSLSAIAKNPRAESLRRELLGRLTEAVRTGEGLAKDLARVTTDAAEKRARAEERIRDLRL